MTASIVGLGPVFQFIDGNGIPYAAGTVTFTETGTTIQQDTFSDVGLTVANVNPLVLDSAGRGLAYFSPVAYDYTVRDRNGVIVYGPITFTGSVPAVPQDFAPCEGRITLTTGVPVTTADVTGAATVYFTPYKGNQIILWNGTAWTSVTFTELSLSIAGDTTGKNYDLWCYSAAGVATLERLVWTNDTTRATGLVFKNGVYVKSGDATRRYLGSYRTTGTGTTEDSYANRLCWNYYNRVTRALRVTDATASWPYTTAAYRQANANALDQLGVLVGVAEEAIDVALYVIAQNTNTGVSLNVAIGLDSTTTPATSSVIAQVTTPFVNGDLQFGTAFRHEHPLGYHTYVWLEQSAATGTTTWRGTTSSGIIGTING